MARVAGPAQMELAGSISKSGGVHGRRSRRIVALAAMMRAGTLDAARHAPRAVVALDRGAVAIGKVGDAPRVRAEGGRGARGGVAGREPLHELCQERRVE